MKWKNSGQRPRLSSRGFVRQIGGHSAARPAPGVKQQRRSQKTRIFVIAQVRQSGRKNALGPKRRQILIFDDHPDSLRLVSRYHLNRDAERPRPRRSQWHLILGLLLILFLIDAMFWPLLMT